MLHRCKKLDFCSSPAQGQLAIESDIEAIVTSFD